VSKRINNISTLPFSLVRLFFCINEDFFLPSYRNLHKTSNLSMQNTGIDPKVRRKAETEHPCHLNDHFPSLKAFLKNIFLNKKLREIRSIIDILEEVDNLSLSEAGYIDKAEKIWKHWIFYTRERFLIVFRIAKENFLPKSTSNITVINKKSRDSIYERASIIDHIKVTIGITNYMSISPEKNKYSYKDSKIQRICNI